MTAMMRRPNPILAKMESLLEEGGDVEAVELEEPITEEEEPVPRADCSRRWLGFPPEKTNDAFLKSKATDVDATDQPLDISLRFLFLQSIPASLAEGMGRNLIALNVSSNNLRSLHGLKNLPRLLELKAYGCELTTLGGLEAPKLAKLDVSDNQLDNSAFLSLRTMRSLEVLNVDKNEIDSLEGVSILHLKELYASTNKLRRLGTSLHRIPSLETLYLDENRLGPSIEASCFKDLLNLTELSLKKNLLRDICFLHIEKLPGQLGLIPNRESIVGRNLMVFCETLPALQYLYVQRNEINRVASSACNNVLELNLENNLMEKITDEFVESFPNLEVCYFGENRFSTLADWKKLADIKSVVEISVKGNPWLDGLSEATRRSQILRDIPHLQIVDEECVGIEDVDTNKVVSNPLMHCKSSSYRCYNEAALAAWEAQQLKTLNAIDCQIQKRLSEGDADLKRMTRYLVNADKVLKKEYELRAKEELEGESRQPTPPFVADNGSWGYEACETYNPLKQTKALKMRRRLDRAKAFEPIKEEPSVPASPTSPASRAPVGENGASSLDPPPLLPLYGDEEAQLEENEGAVGDDECEESPTSCCSREEVVKDACRKKLVTELKTAHSLIAEKEYMFGEEEADDDEVAYINRKGSMVSATTAATSCAAWLDGRPGSACQDADHYSSLNAALGDVMGGDEEEKTETTGTPITMTEESSGMGGSRFTTPVPGPGRGSSQKNYTTPDLDPQPLRTDGRAKRKCAPA